MDRCASTERMDGQKSIDNQIVTYYLLSKLIISRVITVRLTYFFEYSGIANRYLEAAVLSIRCLLFAIGPGWTDTS